MTRAIVDQHFRQRDRLGRLLTALSYNPRLLGIGVDENTAAVRTAEGLIEVVGEGGVTIVDPSEVDYTSIDQVSHGEAVSFLNIRLHVLTEGDRYDLGTRTASPGRRELTS